MQPAARWPPTFPNWIATAPAAQVAADLGRRDGARLQTRGHPGAERRLAEAPFSIETAFTAQSKTTLSASTVTRDLVHRFFENQMQIDGGRNDQFARGPTPAASPWVITTTAAPRSTPWRANTCWRTGFSRARSRLVSQSPVFDLRLRAGVPGRGHGSGEARHRGSRERPRRQPLPRLKLAKNSPPSALEGAPRFVNSGNLAPAGYFGDGKFHAVNTMQPAYQPSGNAPARTDRSARYADPAMPRPCRRRAAPPSGTASPPRTSPGSGMREPGMPPLPMPGAPQAAPRDLRAVHAGRQSGLSAPSSAVQLLRALRPPGASGGTRGALEGLR